MSIKKSELILNSDGSVYHLNLKPEHIADTILFVGDPDRVEHITKHFNQIDVSIQKREFKTQTGSYKGKRISVISTGIGAGNIDIVLNELDALVNIDLKTRKVKPQLTRLNIIRIGTSGSIQAHIPVDSFLISAFGLDLNGMLHFYRTETIRHPEIEKAFIAHTDWGNDKAKPVIVGNSIFLQTLFEDATVYQGITTTASGFYAPQGRILRLPLQDDAFVDKLNTFQFSDLKITNLEMETAIIYGLSKLLGHNAISLNAILANRATGEFSEKPKQVVKDLISFALERIAKINFKN